ncbi:hypothetical protein BE221DRAFT_73066 [Ostreococcus tauri]|uniref:Uncharacterized protein n=1 Tax=Ostreococcus tauri TaxID=70448 RepID=A0A1Y5IB83_OSTTA|nr:hypothetical protein BE221DRAFT_73066 [Ostreococcus tauri]
MFRRAWAFVQTYRAQTRALERIRRERARVERQLEELATAERRNRASEAALGELLKRSTARTRRDAVETSKIDAKTSELTETLAEASMKHVRETMATLEAAAKAQARTSADAVTREFESGLKEKEKRKER